MGGCQKTLNRKCLLRTLNSNIIYFKHLLRMLRHMLHQLMGKITSLKYSVGRRGRHISLLNLKVDWIGKKWANPGLFLFYFWSFLIPIKMTNIPFEQYKLKKAKMVCLGLEPGAAGWKAQTNPSSYGGTPVDWIIGLWWHYQSIDPLHFCSPIITKM